MPAFTTVPCPVEGCDGEVSVEVKLKVESPPVKSGYKPGGSVNISTDGVTLVGDHMSRNHPDLEIPKSLLPR